MSAVAGSRFSVKVEKRTVGYVEYAEANYLMIASGSSVQVHLVSVVLLIVLSFSLHVNRLNLCLNCLRDTNLLHNLAILL